MGGFRVPDKNCLYCGQPIPRHKINRRKKFCSSACVHARKKYTPEMAKARFWARVDMGQSKNDCWLYKGARDKWGYGDIQYLGKHVQAHRLAWRLLRGEPGQMDVLHTCHKPPCCNPEHLYLGTDVENARDRVAAGTQTMGRPKLTPEQVRQIRVEYRQGKRGYHGYKGNREELAARYGVTAQAIHFAASGKSWSHL